MIEKVELQSKIYWERVWNKFSKLNALIAPSSKLIQHLVSNIHRNGVVLDLGCGEGRNSIYLSRIGFNVVAIDSSFEASKTTSSNFFEEELRGKALSGDARYLPFHNDSFDGILAHHILDHLTKVGFEHAVSELLRVLKPGGLLLMTMDAFVTSRSDKDTIVKDDGTVAYFRGPNKGKMVRPYVEEEIASLADKGWEIQKSELTPRRNKMLMLKKLSID